jgi:very-short-patch-repair endonuclease
VDVAVLDSHRPGRYLIGIVLDGRGYYRLPMMRDREIIQPKVLQGLGWTIVRVWQEDFFRHSDATIHQIINKIKQL